MNLPSPDRKSKEEEEPLRKSPKKSVVSLRRVIDSPNENFATEKKEEVIEKDSGSEQECFSIFSKTEHLTNFYFQNLRWLFLRTTKICSRDCGLTILDIG